MATDKLTAREIADELGYHIDHVYRLLRTGTIQAERFNRVWIIPRSELERIKALREQHGQFWAGKEGETKETT